MGKTRKVNILVFASGDADGGGSGFQEMIEFSRTDPPVLDADIVGVISNYPKGGIYKKAQKLSVPFMHWSGPFTETGYRGLVKSFDAEYVMCSGWLKFVRGLETATTINIHPGPLPEFGGKGMYGHYVHEAVIKAYRKKKTKQSAVSMHFVDDVAYDNGPIICKMPVLIRPDDTPETLQKRVNEKERSWQSIVLNQVVNGNIHLKDGKVLYNNENLKKICLGGDMK